MSETRVLPGVTGIPPHPDAQFALGPPAPVEVCQLIAEFQPVLDLYRERKPARVLEIGTACGGTLYHWLMNAQPGATVVSVDWPESGYELDMDATLSWSRDDVSCVLVQGDSHEQDTQEKVAAYGPFDWLFIDGAHTYPDAKQDWDDYRPMCNPGAMVFFHDIALRRIYEDGQEAGVQLLWREIQAEGYLTREYRAKPWVIAYGIGAVKL